MSAPKTTITPGDRAFAAHILLGEAQRYRMVADKHTRKGSGVAAAEMLRDAERLTAVAMTLRKEPANV